MNFSNVAESKTPPLSTLSFFIQPMNIRSSFEHLGKPPKIIPVQKSALLRVCSLTNKDMNLWYNRERKALDPPREKSKQIFLVRIDIQPPTKPENLFKRQLLIPFLVPPFKCCFSDNASLTSTFPIARISSCRIACNSRRVLFQIWNTSLVSTMRYSAYMRYQGCKAIVSHRSSSSCASWNCCRWYRVGPNLK